MKRMIFFTLFFLLFIAGCSSVSSLSPTVVDHVAVYTSTQLILTSDRFDERGNLSEDQQPYAEEELLQLIDELEIAIPELPTLEFQIELTQVDLDYAKDVFEELPYMLQLSGNNRYELPPLLFEESGSYTFIATLQTDLTTLDLDEGMTIDGFDSYFTLHVIVTENEGEETLKAVVNDETFVFEFTITVDLSQVISQGLYERFEEPDVWNSQTSSPNQSEEGTRDEQASSNVAPPTNSGIPEDNATTLTISEGLSYLALVNRHFRLPSHFSPSDLSTVNVASINGTHLLRNTAARAAEALFAQASSEGLSLVATSGYRSYSVQASTHQHWINVMGAEEARRVSARAGHSEHQLGLALDVTNGTLGVLSQTFSATPEGIWLRNNAHHFGFIIRYPAGREADTGYIYEPWHIRYVGVNAATTIANGNLILEDFLN